MAITLVSGGAISGANIDDTSVTIALPTLLEGDVVYISGGFDHIGLGTSPAISTSGYTELAMIVNGNVKAGVWRKKMGATPDSQVVGTNLVFNGSSAASYSVMCWRGVHQTTQEDATTTTATGAGTDPDPASITTVTDGAVVLTFVTASNFDTAVTAPSGYSNQASAAGNDGFPMTSAAASKEIATAGAENPGVWTNWVASGRWLAATVAVRPAAATTKPWYYYAQQ